MAEEEGACQDLQTKGRPEEEAPIVAYSLARFDLFEGTRDPILAEAEGEEYSCDGDRQGEPRRLHEPGQTLAFVQ